MSSKEHRDIVYPSILIAGPTAVGKSGLAMNLASKLPSEIVSVDSMQVYKGMDIGTDKPGKAEKERVPHQMIDVAEVNEPFDAAKYRDAASQTVQSICLRGRLPILCGGSGLYFKALLDGIGTQPPSKRDVREELEKTEINDLLSELKDRDPETFERIDRRNKRRVVRALEVIRLTGMPVSPQRANWDVAGDVCVHQIGTLRLKVFAFGLERSMESLSSRINERVDRMLKRGIINETIKLVEKGLRENRSARQALGYRQVLDYLDGRLSMEDSISEMKIKTRRFAKRQMTWFRNKMKLHWINMDDIGDHEKAVAEISNKAGL